MIRFSHSANSWQWFDNYSTKQWTNISIIDARYYFDANPSFNDPETLIFHSK